MEFHFECLNLYFTLVTPKPSPCRLQTVCSPSTFFLTLDSLVSVRQLQSRVQYVLMFVIYPQAAQTESYESLHIHAQICKYTGKHNHNFLLLSWNSQEPLISLDLASTKILDYYFKAGIHCYYCLYTIFFFHIFWIQIAIFCSYHILTSSVIYRIYLLII